MKNQNLTVEEASKVCRQYIVDHELGGGNWPWEAGQVHTPDGNLVARVSFNGRIWTDPEDLRAQEKVLNCWRLQL